MEISVSMMILSGVFYFLTLTVDGDCGSWVMDIEMDIVYGQIVAGYPGTKTAYLIPMAHILKDIELLVGAVTFEDLLTRNPWRVQLPPKNEEGLVEARSTAPVEDSPVVKKNTEGSSLISMIRRMWGTSDEPPRLSVSRRSESVSSSRYVRWIRNHMC
jgi:hypothetical protein